MYNDYGDKMIKNFLCGMGVGIANIIPGVSGGTILVILGIFDKLMEAVSTIFSTKSTFKEKINKFIFVLQVLIGVAVGLVCFAKVLEYLFVHFELQTIALFAGFILFSIPMLKKQEMNGEKINYLFFIIGILVIALLAYFSPGEEGNIVELEELLSKELNITYILVLIALGAISGVTMIFPGISGSMVLLVLGWYHLFKGYVANVTTFKLGILIPLVFIGIGVGIGIILGAKITDYSLKKSKNKTMSLILGLILMSAIIIFPIKKDLYTIVNIITSLITFLLGGGLIILLEKLKEKKENETAK